MIDRLKFAADQEAARAAIKEARLLRELQHGEADLAAAIKARDEAVQAAVISFMRQQCEDIEGRETLSDAEFLAKAEAAEYSVTKLSDYTFVLCRFGQAVRGLELEDK